MLISCRHEAARITDMNSDIRSAQQPACVAGVVILEQRHHLGIELHRLDVSGTEMARPQDIGIAVQTDQEYGFHWPQTVGQRCGTAREKLKSLRLPGGPVDRRHGVPIEEQPELLRRLPLPHQAEAGCVPERDFRAGNHGEQPQGAGALQLHGRPFRLQGLTEGLVRRDGQAADPRGQRHENQGRERKQQPGAYRAQAQFP